MNAKPVATEKGPVEVVKLGSISVPIYSTPNRIYRRDPTSGTRSLAAEHPQFTVVYYLGRNRVRRKFTTIELARVEANTALVKLANGDSEALKLTGRDRLEYVDAISQLDTWKPGLRLSSVVADYVQIMKRIPEGVSLHQIVDDYQRRHPVGLARKSVLEVVKELVQAKVAAGRSEEYTDELRTRLGRFAKAFEVPINSVTGNQIAAWIAGLQVAGRTQNNFRRVVGTLFKFAKRRGYLPRDWDEMGAVERPEDGSGEIEIFTPAEIRKIFDACLQTVKERKVVRTREEMVPYLAIAAFAGLRAQEIKRLDWSEVHLTGPEKFIEVKASKAKTASRRIVPITENLAAWLARYAQPSGPVVAYERADKQLFHWLAPQAGIQWKRNALRHSFISYRLAVIKNVHQVSLEAGNSAQMVFKHYRQLVTETQAKEWFEIMPPSRERAGIIPMPSPKEVGTRPSDHNAAAAK